MPNLYNQNFYACSSYVVNGQELRKFISDLWSSNTTLSNYNNISENVIRIMVYPFKIDRTELDQAVIQLGGSDTSAKGYIVKEVLPQPIFFTCEFQDGDNDNFLNFEPYTFYDIYLPFIGYVNIEAKYMHVGVKVSYSCNFSTGDCLVNITCSDYIIYTNSINIAFNCPITGSNSSYIQAQKDKLMQDNTMINITTGLNAFLGLGLSVGMMGVGAFTGNPVLIGMGASQAVSTAGGAISNAKQYESNRSKINAMKDDVSIVSYSSSTAVASNRSPRLRITRVVTYYPKNYAVINGKPLSDTRLLKNIRGYTEVESLHIEIPCLISEKDEIENLLYSGVILNTNAPIPDPSPDPEPTPTPTPTPTPAPDTPKEDDPISPNAPTLPEGEIATMLCCFNGKFRVTGMRGTPAQTGRPRNHYGLDLVGMDTPATNTPVYAISSGWVKLTDQGDNYLGKCVHVQMDNKNYYGEWILYGHLSKFEVKNGQYVEKGQLIGLMGNTGASDGWHTHLEWRNKYDKYDPDFSKYDICKFTGIPNTSVTGQNIHIGSPIYKTANGASVQNKLSLENQTIEYLENYEYADDLMKKIDEHTK